MNQKKKKKPQVCSKTSQIEKQTKTHSLSPRPNERTTKTGWVGGTKTRAEEEEEEEEDMKMIQRPQTQKSKRTKNETQLGEKENKHQTTRASLTSQTAF